MSFIDPGSNLQAHLVIIRGNNACGDANVTIGKAGLKYVSTGPNPKEKK
jgi:hypothetical protein